MPTQFLKTKKEILAWLQTNLKSYNKDAFTLTRHPVYGFTVKSSIGIFFKDKKLKEIPIKFSEILGALHIDGNALTSLDFCPSKVYESFNCSNNLLTSLEGGPIEVGTYYICSNNQITSLKHTPKIITEQFNCSNNLISSLEFGPERVTYLYADKNCLENLSFLPTFENISLTKNPLLGSLQYCGKESIDFLMKAKKEHKIKLDKKRLEQSISPVSISIHVNKI